MDRINELLGRLAELTSEELTELRTLMADEAARLAADDTDESTEALTQLAETAEQVAAEDTRRAEARRDREERRDAALARINPVTDSTQPAEDDPDAPEPGPEGEDGGQGDGGGDPAPADTPPAQPAEGEQPTAVAASARSMARIPAQRRPSLGQISARTRPAAPAGPARPQVRTTVSNLDTGRTVSSRTELVEAMVAAVERRPAHDLRVIRAVTEYPAERKLLRGDRPENDALVAAALPPEVLAPEAIVAAGGLCAPVATDYSVDVIGSTARPVRDGIPSFGADRGGISLRPGVVFDDWSGAVGQWTLQNDIDAATAGAPDPTKPIIEALCPGFTQFTVYAVPARVRFRNVTARFDPEGTSANIEATHVWHARFAENLLLARMAQLSNVVTTAKALGAVRDLLVAIDHLVAQYRSRWRYDDTVALAMLMPQWVRDLMRADITRGEYDLEALAVADARINTWFTNRSITPRWHLDGRSVAQASGSGIPAIAAQQYGPLVSGSAMPGFPAQVEALLYKQGDFVFLDGGELNLGTVRDTTTNAVNAYEMFEETFEGIGFRGTAGTAVQLVASVEPTGMSAGRKDTDAFTD
jgi:hypothetical protein